MVTKNAAKKRKALNKTSLSEVTLSLFGSIALIAGFVRQIGLISFLDERLGLKQRSHNISHGEAIVLLMLALTNGKYTAVYDLIDTLDQVPIDQLLNVDVMKASNAQKDVILTALDAIHSYGCEKLFQE